jgi:formylmethanofuran dehydrogenase subunit E
MIQYPISLYHNQICKQCGHYLTDYELSAQYKEQGIQPLCYRCAEKYW